YRTALVAIPANANLSPELRQAVQTARAAIDANNLALENFLEDHLKTLRTKHADEPLGRFDRALDTLLFKRRIYRPQPNFLYYPHLPAIEFYERADFPWLDSIEASTDDIREELLNVLAEDAGNMRPYMNFPPGGVPDQWRELNRSLRWGVYYLWIEGQARAANMARCPRTMAALKAWPPCDMPGCAPTAMFSILEAKSHIPPHAGSNNCRLVVHLPLIVPPDCSFRVGAETRIWEPGNAFVFDDTIEHEARNNSDQWRAVLILDIWNPLLSEAERDMVRGLTAALDDYYRDMPDYVVRGHRPG
ncbi:MAG TPA: aspartyl/asparaginyl beta-hydroxylase domain-containing protein, partial [Caulobacteraceae bacterium]